MQGACQQLQDPMALNYTAVIPKSLRSHLQKSASPPPIPPRMHGSAIVNSEQHSPSKASETIIMTTKIELILSVLLQYFK